MKKLKIYFPALLIIFLLMGTNDVFAQLTSSDVKDALEEEWGTWKDILGIILSAVTLIGGIAVVYAYSTNKNESKDHLTKFIIALIISAIISTTLLAA